MSPAMSQHLLPCIFVISRTKTTACFHVRPQYEALRAHTRSDSPITVWFLGNREGEIKRRGEGQSPSSHLPFCPSELLSVTVIVHWLTSSLSGQILAATPQQCHLIHNQHHNNNNKLNRDTIIPKPIASLSAIHAYSHPSIYLPTSP